MNWLLKIRGLNFIVMIVITSLHCGLWSRELLNILRDRVLVVIIVLVILLLVVVIIIIMEAKILWPPCCLN